MLVHWLDVTTLAWFASALLFVRVVHVCVDERMHACVGECTHVCG